ncbi:aminotransferase class III-fold pyridoxal phosphate-dependent enzyme [Alicyclobacillus pomorum]|uniref:aminotransferase class III-fold pyridoxal phosphate-dependent enzyme n=1 Tax=Alicyclobacillus pomorum TaxID=204470 RepID=UPI001FDFF2C3|nr:aminotransferase class III-fold pyridoxal phosphate-dependent enzyme [Alicyclobacillus pomorum]
MKHQYKEMTPRSMQAFHRAETMIPGGVQGNVKFFDPYPLSFQQADGAWLIDVDGHYYVDYLLSFGALILGHGHPVVKEAVNEVWRTYGTSSFGVPYPLGTEMVALLQSLFPSIEAVRSTNSGLEATLLAIRLGLSFTGKTHIAKFDGHYHGGHERVLISTHSTQGGQHERPRVVSESMGIPDYFLDHTVVLPFNDFPLCEQILREQQEKVGVVILEPVQAGYIPAEQEFIQQLRALTQELGILLVFDEVKTGSRCPGRCSRILQCQTGSDCARKGVRWRVSHWCRWRQKGYPGTELPKTITEPHWHVTQSPCLPDSKPYNFFRNQGVSNTYSTPRTN